MSNHPDEQIGGATHPDTLPWYVAGTLSPAESAAVAAHLERCESCRDEHDALISMQLTLCAHGTDELDDTPPRVPRRAPPWAGMVALAASAVLGFVLIVPALVSPSGARPQVANAGHAVLTPPVRSVGGETRLDGPGVWALTIVLPSSAAAGRYEISVSGDGTLEPGSPTDGYRTDPSGRLRAVVRFPSVGSYRVTAGTFVYHLSVSERADAP